MKKIFIMGASSGIGYGVAEALASRGVHIGVAARRTDRLAELAERYPGMIEYAGIDIDRPDSVREMEDLIARMGGMDIYFHVAGIGYDNPGLDPHREAEITETDTTAFARMISTAYRYFRDSGRRGQIAAITSVAGTKGIGTMAAYSASKKFDQTYLTALEQLSHSEKADISFTDIRPGWTTTALLKEGKTYPLEMAPEYVVAKTLEAIVRKRRVAVIDWRWDIVTRLWRLIPDCLWVHAHVSF